MKRIFAFEYSIYPEALSSQFEITKLNDKQVKVAIPVSVTRGGGDQELSVVLDVDSK